MASKYVTITDDKRVLVINKTKTMRAITDEHLQAYLEGGCLQKLFYVIKKDPELSFEIRMKMRL